MLTIISNSYSLALSISPNSYSNMLTIIPKSYSHMTSNTIYSFTSSITSFIPTLKPTSVTTLKPTSFTTFKPTTNASSFSFTSDIGLSNVKTSQLDLAAQESVIVAQAITMNISSDCITFVSSSISKNTFLQKFNLASFNLLVTTKTVIILNGKYSMFLNDPQSLFTSLTTTMVNAVTSGAFTQNLVAISIQMNSSSTTSASVSSITNSDPTIVTNSTISPTISPTINNGSGNIIKKYNWEWIIIFVSCVSVLTIFNFGYGIYAKIKRKQNRLLNVDEIEIEIRND